MNDGDVSPVEEDEDYEDYLALLAIFKKFIQHIQDEEDRWKVLEELMALRAKLLVKRAFGGFGMTFEEAIELVQHQQRGLTKEDKEKRNILIAAIKNLVDFAVVEEFQMYDDLPDYEPDEDTDYITEAENICKRYNYIYARIENGDVAHAMGMAAWWAAIRSENTVLTYMTQGDNRVRPWHRALEGISYPKHSFPAWLVPPIEHGCRCYLVEESGGMVHNGLESELSGDADIPDFVNPVFLESVAQGGRIFGPAHSYFQIPKGYRRKLKSIAKELKLSWLKK